MPPKPSYQDAPAPSRSHLVAPLLAGGVLAMYVAGIFFLPHELPALTQRAVGLGFALLTAVFVLAVTRRREPPEMLMQRVRLAQHSDFGKQLYTMPASRRHTVQPAFAGAGSLADAGRRGGLLRGSRRLVAEPLADPGEERGAGRHDHPAGRGPRCSAAGGDRSVYGRAADARGAAPRRQLAGMIPDGSMPYSLALRALGRQQFDDARARI